ncbi:hypothetical protein H2200_006043 [Cladophialophora chaetospira]|uniref:Uncharacterized protein n=1 Tax=Cladophialophora chaetospira TaxID=386627 RepID=A0AA38XAT8_9EURO|nr:hypothetical protein H2200_006043 [Cladophialophora chaetospira]
MAFLPLDNDPMEVPPTSRTPWPYRWNPTAPSSRRIDRITATGRNHNFSGCCSELSLEHQRGEKEMLLFNIVADIIHSPRTACDRVVADNVEARSQADARHIDQQPDRFEEKLKKYQPVNGGQYRRASIKDSLIFCKKHAAVLESIKFKGELMRAFERENGTPWFDHPMYHDDPPWPPRPKSVRFRAEELMREFAENPL